MFDVHHTLAIAAPTGRVWRVLYDLNRYRDWHPFISLTGKTELGSVLTLQQKKGLGSLPPLSSDAKLVELEPHAAIGWQLGIKGLIEMEEHFELSRSLTGTDVTHRMRCAGFLSLLTPPVFKRRMLQSLTLSNQSLARFVARGSTAARYAPVRSLASTRDHK